MKVVHWSDDGLRRLEVISVTHFVESGDNLVESCDNCFVGLLVVVMIVVLLVVVLIDVVQLLLEKAFYVIICLDILDNF